MQINFQSDPRIHLFITQSLAEDIGPGDYSTLSCIPSHWQGKAKLLVKDEGVLAGVELAKVILKEIDPALHTTIYINDGASVTQGDIAFEIEGSVASILQAERLLLNCMQRLSGIATTTHKAVSLIEGGHTKILDTRKTTPGMRLLEKWAVTMGGGHNHRFGLYDMIMLKDNHIDAAGGIIPAITKAKEYLIEKHLALQIEVETRNLAEVQQAIAAGGIHRIMLDNFDVATLAEALKLINKQYETEASGGITLSNLIPYAETGVDYISMGALTHSVKALDLSLKLVKGV
ncbi:MAG: carboxylating nicotinate-nucleotide diphosphorylase [Bacteroidota bacterium]|nr:carboxylating nicotinate-nucleotide diphosphorylase [Bacteroidota bacterium]